MTLLQDRPRAELWSMARDLRQSGLVLLAVGVAVSSITINWIVEHDPGLNFFPEFGGRVVYLSDVFIIVGLGLWALGWSLGPRRAPRLGPAYLFLPLLILVVLSALSVVWAQEGSIAGFATVRRLMLLVMYVALVNETRRVRVPMVAALLVIGLLQAAVAWAQVLRGGAIGLVALGEVPESALGYAAIGCPRPIGLGFNPNPLGLFLAVVGATVFALFLFSRGSLRVRVLLFVPMQVVLLALAAVQSRGALVGCLMALAAVTALAWMWAPQVRSATLRRAGCVALMALLTLQLYPALFPLASYCPSRANRFQPAVIGQSTSYRLDEIARFAMPIIGEHPILGVGAANLPLTITRRFDIPAATPVHNVTMLIFAELGLLGAVAWIAVMGAPLVWAWSRRATGAAMSELVWLGAVIPPLAYSLLDFTPWATQDGRVLLFAMLGLWAGSLGSSPRPAVRPRLAASGILPSFRPADETASESEASMKSWSVAVGLLAVMAGVAEAQEPRSILFVGNSFTYGHGSAVRYWRPDSVTDLNREGVGGVPALFKAFVDQVGLPYDVYLETRGGSAFDFHLREKRAEITRQPWDVVVAHGFSTLDSENPNDPTALLATGRELADLLEARNPEVEFYVTATWSRPDLTYGEGTPWSGKTIDVMGSDVDAAYDRLAAEVPGVKAVNPVGEAFNRAIRTGVADSNPYDGIAAGTIDLWTYDHYHASSYGYYLEALVVFGNVTGVDPLVLGQGECSGFELGMSTAQVEALLQVAHDELAASGVELYTPSGLMTPTRPSTCAAP